MWIKTFGGRKILLASASPRRAELLTRAGVDFEVLRADYSDIETGAPEGADPAAFALESARSKLGRALETAAGRPGFAVVCADTVVDADGLTLGKPADAADARRMLRALSGRAHKVHTGVALAASDDPGRGASFIATTSVAFRPLDDAMIDAYVETGEPFDKAGAYGIQERAALFVEKVDGLYSNVVGLPVSALVSALEKIFGIDI
jgi:septum formation protein